MSEMTDRELLELAAKAAGIELTDWSEIEQAYRRKDGGYFRALTDDGDALRLAVKLRILGSPELAHFLTLERFANQDKDDCYAHRRAIVRAAATIGKEGE